jgi:hypothetical protein
LASVSDASTAIDGKYGTKKRAACSYSWIMAAFMLYLCSPVVLARSLLLCGDEQGNLGLSGLAPAKRQLGKPSRRKPTIEFSNHDAAAARCRRMGIPSTNDTIH